MIFEPRRSSRAGGAEPGEARAEMIFELRRSGRAAGAEPDEARAEIEKFEARAEIIS